jgi:hypothetical protein
MLLKVKRCHGLGNLLMLLPVLIKAGRLGRDVTLVTRPDWVDAIAPWCPGIRCAATCIGVTHDLDALTGDLLPRMHRTLEFADALEVPGPFPLLSGFKPAYQGLLARQFAGAILFAPEAGHDARIWPSSHSIELAQRLLGRPLILIGMNQVSKLPCDVDLRGKLSLAQMFELVSVASCVISMDSGAMQVAMSLDTPVVAIFGGVDPTYRVFPNQNARVLVAPTRCRPCNKRETCNGEYSCLHGISVQDVCDAVEGLDDLRGREIRVSALKANWQ